MGSVKLETRNEGRGLREWDYMPLGEERVVMELLRNRSRYDESFWPLLEERRDLSSNGVFPFSEPVLCVYADLDRLIEEAHLSPAERRVVDLTMRGYGITDIGERYERTRQAIYTLLRRAVVKVCKRNDEHWLEVHGTCITNT